MRGWKWVLSLLLICLFTSDLASLAFGQARFNAPQFDEKIKNALAPEKYPSREAYAAGEKMARETVSKFKTEKGNYPLRVAGVLWGVETTGKEGPMVSFALALIGVRLKWDASGKVTGLELISLDELGRPRIDVVMVTTGLFRDLFQNQIILLDRAYRLALASSYQSIASAYPELQSVLDATLVPLEKAGLLVKGKEPLESNYVARRWVVTVRKLLAAGHQQKEAGELAVAGIFAPPVGEYGSGVMVLGFSQDHEKMAEQFVNRVSNVYSETIWGTNQPDVFRELLKGCNVLVHSYSEGNVLEQDDLPLEYTYLRGLRAALEKLDGGMPDEFTSGNENLKKGERDLSGVKLAESNAPDAAQKTSANTQAAETPQVTATELRGAGSNESTSASEGDTPGGQDLHVFEVEACEIPAVPEKNNSLLMAFGLLVSFFFGAGRKYLEYAREA
ncbi:cobaltochelatase subunit CobN [Desulfovirgula thermocuniculi]|uniref:cobaltochelatase subunit CobN n=1 Tax=Desulfovirgula thermocuniculi TaxID=348842 RepID=UPI000487DBA5|nr:cobaltochelatase subunit CobN [Desulfovirgula thermocuniculi]